MTTKNPFVEQWIEFNKLAIDSFQKMATNNVTVTNQMLTGFVDVRGVAELTQSYLSLFKGMGDVYTKSVNDVFKTQLDLLKLQATSKAYKDFGEFYLDGMTKLGKNQADWMQLYIDMISSYLDKVSQAKEVSDLALYVPKQTLTDEFQKKANDTLEQTLYILNSLNVGIELMTQKTVDAMAEA